MIEVNGYGKVDSQFGRTKVVFKSYDSRPLNVK